VRDIVSKIWKPFIRDAGGFSLVEIMVGLAIGMLAVIVMLQVFALSEQRKRTSVGGGDAQSNGAIALYQLQRDIRQSGQGIVSTNLFGCSLPLPSGGTLSALAPLTINSAAIPAGDANTDTLLVVYADSGGSTQGDMISSQPTQNNYLVVTSTSFHINDWVVAAPQTRSSPCNLAMEKLVTVSPNLTVTTGVAGMTNGTLYNLGQNPTVSAYRVSKGNLTVCDYMQNNCGDASKKNDDTYWAPVANGIVSLRAQYGRDTNVPIDSIVDLYDRTTPVSTSATYACDWMSIPAARIAIVGRNSQYEIPAQNHNVPVTSAAPTWAGTVADNPPNSESNPIDLTKNPDGSANSEWQNYRYKLFETVVPIRNVAWAGAQSGC
jgi:type IV pilus assembly protein PilW